LLGFEGVERIEKNIEMKIDIIILSNCINDKIFRMNQECLTSLEESESNFDFSVKLIESNKQFSKEYKTNLELEIIIPQEDFNYNRFLNIGLDKCSSEFIAFCNIILQGCKIVLTTINIHVYTPYKYTMYV